MRWLISIVVLLAVNGCEHGEGGAIFCLHDGEVLSPGEFFPAGDGCNFCSCETNGNVTCSTDPCSDGGPIIIDSPTNAFCSPSGSCLDGVECNGQCCNAGESCDGGICSCGGSGPCTQGDTCVSGGPVGGAACGSICCGVTTPCPI